MPGDFFLLAADCVHTHTYDHPHHIDIQWNNDCPCCLKRVYNKGARNEKVKWVHNTLVFSFIFMGNLKIPVYRYSIRAQQVVDFEHTSEEKHKQECELVALKATLPIIREAFPKMHIVLLLDGLYGEDDCKIRKDNGPENFSVIRRVKLNLLKADKKTKAGIKNKRSKAGWDKNYMLEILGMKC